MYKYCTYAYPVEYFDICFYHEKKYSQEEFEKIIDSLLIDVLNESLKEDKFVGYFDVAEKFIEAIKKYGFVFKEEKSEAMYQVKILDGEGKISKLFDTLDNKNSKLLHV